MKTIEEKQYWEMTTAELREATREYDAEMLGLPGKPLTAADRKILAQARRRGSQAYKRIQVTLPRELRRAMDAAAKKWGVSRSELIARSLREMLKRAG